MHRYDRFSIGENQSKGEGDDFEKSRELIFTSFKKSITGNELSRFTVVDAMTL